MSVLKKYDSSDDLMEGIALKVSEELISALANQDSVSLAVPGGTTPAPFFKILSEIELDWDRVFVTLTDERFVPETSDRSNTRLLKETLLIGHAAKAHLVPFYANAATPEDVIFQLEAGLKPALPLDICVLGMGTDMHTASLFPGADKLEQALASEAPNILPMRAKGAPEPRLTLTAPVLTSAKSVHLLIKGQEKLDALRNAQIEESVKLAPVKIILNEDVNTTIHYAE